MNTLSFREPVAPPQCTPSEFAEIKKLFEDQIRSKFAKRTLSTLNQLALLSNEERISELRTNSIRFVRAHERYAHVTLCKLPRKLSKELDDEWCGSFVRIMGHLYNRELKSPREAVLAAYVSVYVARIWQAYAGGDMQSGVRNYVPHDAFLNCFDDLAANLADVCKATGLPPIRLHDLCTFVSQYDVYVNRGREHYSGKVDPAFWSSAVDASDENEREIVRVCTRIRHSSKWPSTLADNVNESDTTRNFYFLTKNLFCACAFSMCMFRTSAIDALRAIQVRADELYVLLFKVSGQMMSAEEIVEVMYQYANAEHPSNRVKRTAPQEICMTDRIFRD
jgi:hypothetical protein